MQWSIRIFFGTSSFFLHINDLQLASDFLDPIMYANDRNLFYSKKDINTVFLKVNDKLQEINEWSISNKVSLNMKKTNTHFSTNLAKKVTFH